MSLKKMGTPITNSPVKNPANKLDVVITNGWDRISYNVLRSLARSGLNVGFGTDKDLGMGVYSNFKHHSFIYTSPSKDEEKFVDDVINFIKEYKVPVFIPTGDEILTVAKQIKKFENLNVKIPISSYSTLYKLQSKKESFLLAKALGIPVPETLVPESLDDIYDFGNKYGYPIILKDFFSTSLKGVYFVNQNNCIRIVSRLIRNKKLSFGNFLIQEYAKGSGYGVSLLLKEDSVIAKFTHKRIREKFSTGGPSTLRVSTNNSILEELAVKLLRQVDFNGVAMVEFRYDEENNKAKFLEVNPRFWGSLALAINSGIDFPVLLYRIANQENVETEKNYTVGVKHKWLLGDTYAIIKSFISSGKFSLLKRIFEKADGYDDYYKDDKKPFFAFIYLLMKRRLRRIFDS